MIGGKRVEHVETLLQVCIWLIYIYICAYIYTSYIYIYACIIYVNDIHITYIISHAMCIYIHVCMELSFPAFANFKSFKQGWDLQL